MIDLILFAAIFGAWYFGVYCGKKYGTAKASFNAAKAWAAGLLN